jgi:ketosteroid isomerase-like protein
MRVGCWIASVLACAFALPAAAQSSAADQVWAREKVYWQYVQAYDVEGYRSIWHADFLGWPFFSPGPVRKDHIADWIATYRNSGQRLESYELEALSIQVTGNLATTTYRIHQHWVDKSGADHPSVSRIIHTWLRGPDGTWTIVSGMSSLPDSTGH